MSLAQCKGKASRSWTTRIDDKKARLAAIAPFMTGKTIPTDSMVEALEALIRPMDRVMLESSQKQADFLSRSLALVNPRVIHDLHIVIMAIGRSEHLDIFEKGIAKKIDFSFAGPQSHRVYELINRGILEIGAIHTYVELASRLFVDLTPKVCLVSAEYADREGNLYTGANTEDTPAIVEATAFSNGIVVVQVNEIVDKLPRVDIPGGWVDVIVKADRPFALEPIQTRDPKDITELQILTAMMIIKGIYAPHKVTKLNHGVGFSTAAVELLLPTYGEKLGLKGKICRNWVLNPQPTLIPSIESGWVESIHSFGNEDGMQEYIRARPDIFFTGHDGSLRSNRAFCQLAGHYAVDCFSGSTLQIDPDGNTSTVTLGRIAGFGGAPNLGSDARGRRHSSPAWLSALTANGPTAHGRKLVVQIVETFKAGGVPTFVPVLDAVRVGREAGLPVAPIMIYGEDCTHIVTEQGIAYLYKSDSPEERREILASVAGVTSVGLSVKPGRVRELREAGKVAYPEDLGIHRGEARRSLLSASNMKELADWSGNLYQPPARFVNW